MDLLIFGGEGYHNKSWAEEVDRQLGSLFDHCTVHNYLHWQNDGQNIDIQKELTLLPQEVMGLNSYIVIAKSIGTVLTAMAIKQHILNPQKCIFLGIPMMAVDRHKVEVSDYYKSINVPVMFIQNNHDPLGSATDVKEYLEELASVNYQFIELQGDTHDYSDYGQLKTIVANFLSK